MPLLYAWFFALNTAAQNIVMLGDSNTSIGGDDCDTPRGWNYWFCDRMESATCKSYARSGATWTNTPYTLYNIKENIGVLGNDNVMYNQVNRLVADWQAGKQRKPDMIIMAAGTNDAWFLNQRPHALDATAQEAFADTAALCSREACEVLTLAESMAYCHTMLRRCFPNAVIMVLTPMQTTATSMKRIARVGDLMELCAKKMGAHTIRLDKESCVRRDKELKHKTYTTDGTHTNESGARKNGEMIAEKVRKILDLEKNKY